jgi:hypothetical protein
MVYAHDGSIVKVLGTYEHGIRDVYEITTTNGQVARSCDQHLWEITERNHANKKNKPKLVNTKYIEENIYNKYGKLRISLPENKAVSFVEKNLALHPYVLGCLLGDGSIGKNSIVFANSEKELVEKFAEFLPPNSYLSEPIDIKYTIQSQHENNKPANSIEMTNASTLETKVYSRVGELLKDHPDLNRGGIFRAYTLGIKYKGYYFRKIDDAPYSNNPVKCAMKDLGLVGKVAYEKFIPDVYKYSSVEQRLWLLKGIMDTDGTIKKNGEMELTTTSEQLAKDVVDIVRSLGGKAMVYERDRIGKSTILNGKNVTSRRISYQVNINIDKNIFYLTRKAERFNEKRKVHRIFIEKCEKVGSELVKCIKIDHPDQLYITDDFIVTHNTVEDKLKQWVYPIIHNFNKCQSSAQTEKMQKEEHIEILPVDFMMGITMNDILIVDEFQNLTEEEFKGVISRLGNKGKIFFCGDPKQTKSSVTNSCFNLAHKLKDSGLVAWTELTSNHRNPVLPLIFDILDN